MGHHYNPQRLLRNFQIPDRPGFIWQHDKRRAGPVCASIRKVAQERDFYSSATEERLNRLVEMPGGDAIDKILARQPLSPKEQLDLAIHIGTMLRRTPAHRIWAMELANDIMPDVMNNVRENGRAYMRRCVAENQLSEELAMIWLDELEKSIEKHDGKPCDEAVQMMNDPFPSVTIVGALLTMTWRIVGTTGPQMFLTSDNPATYIRYEGYGLGGKEAEIVMPVSTNVALHGSRNDCHPSFSCVPAHQKIVREINKRIVSHATRFVFTHDRAPWLAKLLTRDDLGIMRIGW